jgi:hypothetical protein
MKIVSTSCRVGAIVALALAAFGGNALAADAADEITVRPPLLAAPAAPVATSAFMVGIDNATGLLRQPTVGERIELAAMAREAGAGLRRAFAASEVRHADGSVSMALDPALHSATTVVIDADGQAHYSCGHAGDAGHLHPITVTAPAAEDR